MLHSAVYGEEPEEVAKPGRYRQPESYLEAALYVDLQLPPRKIFLMSAKYLAATSGSVNPFSGIIG